MGKCVICKKEYYGYGHNAAPVEDGKCCDKCNEFVIEQRIVALHSHYAYKDLQQRIDGDGTNGEI